MVCRRCPNRENPEPPHQDHVHQGTRNGKFDDDQLWVTCLAGAWECEGSGAPVLGVLLTNDGGVGTGVQIRMVVNGCLEWLRFCVGTRFAEELNDDINGGGKYTCQLKEYVFYFYSNLL